MRFFFLNCEVFIVWKEAFSSRTSMSFLFTLLLYHQSRSLSESWFVFFQFTSIWKLGRKRVFWNMNVAFFHWRFLSLFLSLQTLHKQKNQNLLVLKFPISLFVIEIFFLAEFRWFCEHISAFPNFFSLFSLAPNGANQKKKKRLI